MVAMMGCGSAAEQGWRKGPWTPEEDKLLSEYVNLNGEGRWSCVARCAGLKRNGKSCRLRWVNYLRPGLKRGPITPQEEAFIIELHALWGNKWSTIARYLPGRTDNEIKNFWRTHFKKKAEKSTGHQIKQEKRKVAEIQQQQLEEDEENMKMIRSATVAPHVEPSSKLGKMSHHEEAETSEAREEDRVQCCFPQGVEYSWSDIIDGDEEGLWGRLWNLDDDDRHLQARSCMDHTISHYCNNRIIGMHHEATPLYNDDFYNGNGGHIF